MLNLKKNGTYELIYKRESHGCRKQSYGYQIAKRGRDTLGDWDLHINNTVYKIDN